MSYRDDKQSLESPISKILKGMAEFDEAVSERIKSREWQEDHIDDLLDIRVEMTRLRNRLEKVARDTW